MSNLKTHGQVWFYLPNIWLEEIEAWLNAGPRPAIIKKHFFDDCCVPLFFFRIVWLIYMYRLLGDCSTILILTVHLIIMLTGMLL